MRSAVYEPDGIWGSLIDLTPSQIAQINASKNPDSTGRVKPELQKRLPSYPDGKMKDFPFWRPIITNTDTEADGQPRPFMRAGSPIDRKSGVYFIWNTKTKTIYIGSSIGTSKNGNVRRTLARHWQEWNRNKPLTEWVTKAAHQEKGARLPGDVRDYKHIGGVVVPRNHIYVCIMPIENDDPRVVATKGNNTNRYAPRQVEYWYHTKICDSHKCLGINQLNHVKRDTAKIDFDVPF